ncbi:MAG: hypothetical protein AB1427_05015 [Thermodesulfobacteriota bacterium]
MSSLPSIGVITTSTNSFSRGYLAYLACIDSWGKFADQIVIVDGGTTDESYDILKSWTSAKNWMVYNSPQTFWGPDGRWHGSQWTINATEGLQKLETDWGFVINSDYILDFSTTANIRQVLAENHDEYGVIYKRFKLSREGQILSSPMSGYALNLKKLRNEQSLFGFGISKKQNYPSDAPIYFQQQTRFYDPVSNIVKKSFYGERIQITKTCGLSCVVYGHYFFSMEQLLSKLNEFHNVFTVRYGKKAPKSGNLFIVENRLSKGAKILPKAQEVMKPHLPEIRNVIEQYYNSEMMGNMSNHPDSVDSVRYFICKYNHKMKDMMFKFSAFPSVQENQKWVIIGDDSKEPLDIKSLYQRQDRFLPKYARIEWN